MASDKTPKTPGYEKAMTTVIQNFSPANIQRYNSTRLIITVPTLPEYTLPKYDKEENIAALDIPQSAVEGQMPITQKLGLYTLKISGVGELYNTLVQIPSAGVKGLVHVELSTRHEVESSHQGRARRRVSVHSALELHVGTLGADDGCLRRTVGGRLARVWLCGTRDPATRDPPHSCTLRCTKPWFVCGQRKAVIGGAARVSARFVGWCCASAVGAKPRIGPPNVLPINFLSSEGG